MTNSWASNSIIMSLKQMRPLFDEHRFVHVMSSASEVTDFVITRVNDNPALAVRFVRGQKMLRETDVFDEFAAAWQFPWYFGENWNAFDECITDLEWIAADSFLTIILDSNLLLMDAEEDALDAFVKHMAWTREEWARPIARGEPWDRSSKWFGIIFHCECDNEKEWRQRFAPFKDQITTVHTLIR